MPTWRAAVLSAAFLVLTQGGTSLAQEASGPSFALTLSDHRFQPVEIAVPAGRTFTLVITNQDRMVEEFESKDLGIEKLVPGGKEVTLRLGPLKPGSYDFVGEFHAETAKGRLVAR